MGAIPCVYNSTSTIINECFLNEMLFQKLYQIMEINLKRPKIVSLAKVGNISKFI